MAEIAIVFGPDEIESARRADPATMSEDDLRWCVCAQITISDDQGRRLELFGSLLHFFDWLGESMAAFKAGARDFEICDLNGSYQLKLTRHSLIRIEDLFSRGDSVELSLAALQSSAESAFPRAIDDWVACIPELAHNAEFQRVSREVASGLRSPRP